MPPCPFCEISADRLLLSSEAAVAFLDAYPISDGHALVVPKRHVSSMYELTATDQQELWDMVSKVRDLLIEHYDVHSFNIGLNDGLEAGQTIEHAHIDVIPRRPGDVDSPKGGVRWIIAEKADYWTK
jgi:diadenosine tetraphosphate (Ap4A) HIT family hydrolase